MTPVTMHDAKTNLSKYVALIESGTEDRITIVRGNGGSPVAMIVPYAPRDVSARLGVARGLFAVPDDIDACNDDIAAMFEGE